MVSLDHFIDLSAQNAIKFKSFITTIYCVFICELNVYSCLLNIQCDVES